MRDVHEALPRLNSPLTVQVCIQPAGGLPGRCYPYVAVGLVRGNGQYREYKRYGRECRSDDTATVMRHLLLAAQELYLWCEGKEPREIARLIAWQLDAPL
jgi:hypothetical protein